MEQNTGEDFYFLNLDFPPLQINNHHPAIPTQVSATH